MNICLLWEQRKAGAVANLHVPGYRGIKKSLRAGERHVCQILLAEQEYQRDLVYHTEML